jgi:hypothetical protein
MTGEKDRYIMDGAQPRAKQRQPVILSCCKHLYLRSAPDLKDLPEHPATQSPLRRAGSVATQIICTHVVYPQSVKDLHRDQIPQPPKRRREMTRDPETTTSPPPFVEVCLGERIVRFQQHKPPLQLRLKPKNQSDSPEFENVEVKLALLEGPGPLTQHPKLLAAMEVPPPIPPDSRLL